MSIEIAFASSEPSPALAGLVTALHFHGGPVARCPFRRLPGPFAALVVHSGDAGYWRRSGETAWRPYPKVALHGLSTEWSAARRSVGSPCLVALIEPWAVETLFGLPPDRTVNDVLDLGAQEIFRSAARTLDPCDLGAALESRAGSEPPSDLLPMLEEARRHAGSSRVGNAARSAGLEERSLRRLFRAHVGVSPKRWFLVERFAANLRRLHPTPWGVSASPPDYFDQAHEIREFRHFAGVTPGAYAREKRAGDRRLFAFG